MTTKSTTGPLVPIQQWLLQAVEVGASDLHVVEGYPPTLRLHGELQPLAAPPLSGSEVRLALTPFLSPDETDVFQREKNLDFAFQLEKPGGVQRFRANYFMSGQHQGACFRIIPSEIPDLAWANFPPDLAARLVHFRDGLVLIVGATGSGKTTTLAMIVNLLSQETGPDGRTTGYRIITIEEPIEYVFAKTATSVVTQREVGHDVHSFADGLKYGLRQDPDVILVGEIRDRETGQMALSAAETGHLVFATMHTRDAKGAISRYADLFPQNVQNEIRAQLSTSLRAVISQHLLPSTTAGGKRELALEILINNSPIGSAIRFGKIESIDNSILTGRADGMLTLDESVKRLLQAGKITRATAEQYVSDPSVLRR
jgi:twitching motility protein PilT